MARIYARRRGKAGSKRPPTSTVLGWVDVSAEEVEKKVIELYNRGLSTSEIGIVLRDGHGVPRVPQVVGKKITEILRERNLAPEIPEDLQNLMRRALRIRKHLEVNKKDVHNRRALQLTESKIRRLVKYYVRKRVLPSNWKYKPESAEFVLRR